MGYFLLLRAKKALVSYKIQSLPSVYHMEHRDYQMEYRSYSIRQKIVSTDTQILPSLLAEHPSRGLRSGSSPQQNGILESIGYLLLDHLFQVRVADAAREFLQPELKP
jgi:hypothetical protein